MPLLPRLLLLFTTVFAGSLSAAFEGRVHFDMTSGRDQQQIVYALKADKARFEMPSAGAGVASILNVPRQEMFILMPEQRMYMVMPLQSAVQATNQQMDSSAVTFEDTGETETILGRTCRKYRVTDRDSTTEIWGAEGMGTFMGQLGAAKGGRGQAALPAWQQQLSSKGFFPLRVVGQNKRGKETFRMQATKIDETPLPDSLFEVPEGYQQLSMGGMLRGMVPGLR